MLIEDIASLMEDLHKTYSAKEVSRHFGRERKWLYSVMNGCGIHLNPEFIAGLNHFGYELRLVRKEK
jgi:hypothetical protein